MEWILADGRNKEEIGEANCQRKLKGLCGDIVGNPQKGKKVEAHDIQIFSSTGAEWVENRLKASHKCQEIQGIGGDLVDRIGRGQKKDPCR